MTSPFPPSTLDVRDLSIAIGQVQPVAGVSFTVNAGETFALVGESGCGKSMTALALMRLLPDAARVKGGSVRLGDTELLGLTEGEMRQRRGRDLAMIFQEPATSLNAVLTVGQQIAESLALHRQLHGTRARTVGVDLLRAVGIPDPDRRWDEYPFQLSGGMKQRAMIAMALAGEPGVLIADEPTTALDVTIQAQVLDVLTRLQRERGMSLVLITHDLGVVSRMADQVGVMYAGQLVEIAPRDAFFSHPAHPYSSRLFAALPDANRRGRPLAIIPGRVPALDTPFKGCRFADRCERVMTQCHEHEPELILLKNGGQVRCHLYQAGDEAPTRVEEEAGAAPADEPDGIDKSSPLLEVEELKVHFPIRKGLLQRVKGHVRAVDGVSLSLLPGQTLALVGESGCGKTTLGKAVLRMLAPTSGEVRFAGQSLIGLEGRRLQAARGRMQMVFQDPFGSLNPRMRVGDIITEGMQAMKLPGNHGHRVAELLQQVGLAPEMKDRFPHEFSGGQRQRIAIARALAVNPSLLVCDEPTSALDVSVQAQVLNLLKDLQVRLGLAYLFITHNIAVVDYLADRVAVMYLGRIVETGSAEEILRDPRHPYTAALIAAVPRVEEDKGELLTVPGDMPSPSNPPAGCHFHPRCPKATEECRTTYPAPKTLSPTRSVSCHWA